MSKPMFAVLLSFLLGQPAMSQQPAAQRPRAREVGLVVGVLDPGPLNAITDVAGVRVGQRTVVSGDTIHTGITAILPPGDDWFHQRVPAAIVVGNAFGKLLGVTQVEELGELETPILLTCTLCVWRAADAMVSWLLARPGMQNVRSINPVVGETNDGSLNDIRSRPITPEDVVAALESASDGLPAEGAVGAGAGTIAFGWKGGIGTSSRVLPASMGGYTVGVLVQTNFGGILTINGAPVGRELGRYAFQRQLERRGRGGSGESLDAEDQQWPSGLDAAGFSPDGSIMMVVATDAPLEARGLRRLAHRALTGLARTGSSMSNGSGDYVIAFSTAESVRRDQSVRRPRSIQDLPNDLMSPLFQAVAEATEEAIYNSLFKATSVSGPRGTVDALPIDQTLEVLKKYNALHWDRSLPPGNGGRH